MSSLNSALIRQALSKGIVRRVADDTPIAIRLRYKGTGTVTSVNVTTASKIELTTSDGGTDTYSFTTYTTMGALVDAINADGIFEAKLIDALRSDSTSGSPFVDNTNVTSGTDENGVIVWDALIDTSSQKTMTVCVSPTSPNFNMPKGHRVSIQEIQYNVDIGTASGAADSVRIYRRRGNVESKIWSAASVDATLTTINFASGRGMITGNPDDEFVVRVEDATSITDAAGNFLQVVGIYE